MIGLGSLSDSVGQFACVSDLFMILDSCSGGIGVFRDGRSNRMSEKSSELIVDEEILPVVKKNRLSKHKQPCQYVDCTCSLSRIWCCISNIDSILLSMLCGLECTSFTKFFHCHIQG